MNPKWTLTLALAAGFLGGTLSSLSVISVHAQTPNAVPKEIRAQSFVLVNDQGVALGTFTSFTPQGPPGLNPPSTGRIRLFDTSGHEVWSAGGNTMRPASH